MVEARENFHQGIEIVERQALFAHLYKFLDKRCLLPGRAGQHDLSCHPIAHLHKWGDSVCKPCDFLKFVCTLLNWVVIFKTLGACSGLLAHVRPTSSSDLMALNSCHSKAVSCLAICCAEAPASKSSGPVTDSFSAKKVSADIQKRGRDVGGGAKKGTSIQSHNAQVEGDGYGIHFREAGNPNGFGRFGVDCVLDAAKLLEMSLELCGVSLGVSAFFHHFEQLVACSLRKHRLEGGNPLPQKL